VVVGLMIASLPVLMRVFLPVEVRAVALPSLRFGWLDAAALLCFTAAAVLHWRGRQGRRSAASSEQRL
jgi:hypothetical protein